MNVNVPLLNMTLGGLISRVVLILIAIIWTVPTFGLFISSFRDKDQLNTTGWWTTLQVSRQNAQARTFASDAMIERDGQFIISGNILENAAQIQYIVEFGGGFLPVNEALEDRDNSGIRDYQAGETVTLPDGSTFTIDRDGNYEWVSGTPFDMDRGGRFFYVAEVPPQFTLDNYNEVLTRDGIDQAFLNTLTVTIPATIIPIVIAAFASYAFSWMEFPGRRFLFAVIIGLLVVPLQLALIPLLRFYSNVGLNATYPGIWLAHTGFGLPLAIYLLRNYIGGLPREIIESAKIDGASHFKIFTQLILPLSIPALASFAIFQFLWVWNDLLVAMVFLGTSPDNIVMTSKIREMLGSRGDNWQVLTSAAFISIVVPLIVFFSLQRYFVRGLLAGSVKGG